MRLNVVFLSCVSSALISQRNATSEFQFEAFRESLVYAEAEKACQEKDMVLATIKDEEENKMVTEYLQSFTRETSLTGADDTYSYWIGLRRVISKPKNWFWQQNKSNCKLTNTKNGFWGIDPPRGVGGGDIQINCVRMQINWGPSFTHKSNWVAHRCDHHQGSTGYICQKTNTGKVTKQRFNSITIITAPKLSRAI